MRILMIGNSFSEDTMTYAAVAAASAGVELYGASLYVGGCSLSQHLDFIAKGEAPYVLQVFQGTEPKQSNSGFTLEAALRHTEWDVITFQQVSGQSGLAETYGLLDDLYSYVTERISYPVRYAWNMTWAYQSDSHHGCFAHYGNDQAAMYRAILHAVDQKIRPRGLPVIPCGVAVQKARAALGDCLTRDGFHLSLTAGRYTAALTLLATLADIAPERVTFLPEGLSPEDAALCRAAVTAAVDAEKNK